MVLVRRLHAKWLISLLLPRFKIVLFGKPQAVNTNQDIKDSHMMEFLASIVP